MGTQLTKNFTLEEVVCKCGCGFRPKQSFVDKMQELRDAFGHAMKITSAARCDSYNRAIGGAPQSQHIDANAIDVVVPIELRWALVHTAMRLGWYGVGVNSAFIHLDRRSEARLFTY